MKYYIFLYLFCIAIKSFSQQQAPLLKDLGEWETIYNGDISNNGKWMFYYSQTEKGNDTLILKANFGKKQYKIPQGYEGSFTKNNKYFTVMPEAGLMIIDLENDTTEILKDILKRSFTKDETFLICERQNLSTSSLVIKNAISGTESILKNITEYQINPLQNKIAMVKETTGSDYLILVDLDNHRNEILCEFKGNIHNLLWSKNGKSLAFMTEMDSEQEKISWIDLSNGTSLESLYPSENEKLNGFQLQKDYIEISPDGNVVFFKARPQISNQTEKLPGVQKWLTEDKLIYPMRKSQGLLEPDNSIWAWNTKTQSLHQITADDFTKILRVNNDFLLKMNLLAYEPEYKFVADVDFTLYDIHTGSEKPFLKKQNPNLVFIDPNGMFIVYFKNENWYSYALANGKTVNLSERIKEDLWDSASDRPDQRLPYSLHIKWLENTREILVSDEYDIWKISLDGKKQMRLTQGREIKRKYRTVMDFLNPKKLQQDVVNPENGFLLHATDENRNSGYFICEKEGSLIPITFGSQRSDGINYDEDLKYISCRIQSYNMSPKIVLFDRAKNKIIRELVSNGNQKIKNWGKPELIKYKMKQGDSSQAFLISPVDYNPQKKYPMVVFIYERQTERMHDFYPISDYGTSGFNPTHYALDGYFVLMPDIKYSIGNPGLSALKYVNESIDYVLREKNVDSTKIGLYGFSFGGYESAFISTQTGRFAAITAGAAVTNLVTFYHAINWSTGQEEMWRMEDYQMRMGKPYYEIKEEYIKNSPFHSIENISSPILLWAGAEDYHIDFSESIRFYLALRRLHKNGKLLLFEEEGHNIMDSEKRRYLGEAIKNWFDTYCKP